MEYLNEIKELRKNLHTIAELSGQEEKTAELITKELKKCEPHQLQTNIGSHGIIATYIADQNGPHLVFRSELDALPIQEVNSFDHKSKTDGVSHKCGHDGHMSILLGLAKHLYSNPIAKGKVSLLFQPAEENGEGAEDMISSGKMKDHEPIDHFYSLHNIPGNPKHQIHCREGIFTPHVISLELILDGKESHAAEPENGINPASAIAKIIQALSDLQNLDKASVEFKLITPVFIDMGQVWYGISAGQAKLGFTIRTWETAVMRQLQKDCLFEIEKICHSHNLQLASRYFEEFNSVINHETAAGTINSAAAKISADFVQMKHPMNWGEDYGLFTQKYSGAMFGLGAGTNVPSLHNPDYDFPDEIAQTGIRMFIEIIRKHGLFA